MSLKVHSCEGLSCYVQGSLRVNRFNPYEGYVGSESVGQDILLAGRTAMNRAMEGDIVAVELLPEDQWVRS
jgi:exosome complex exonuclease DIS3/RRP44